MLDDPLAQDEDGMNFTVDCETFSEEFASRGSEGGCNKLTEFGRRQGSEDLKTYNSW